MSDVDEVDEERLRELIREELADQAPSSTRRGFIGGVAAGSIAGLAGGGAVGGAAGATADGDTGTLDVGGVTSNTYRISGNRYGGPATARTELNSELGSGDTGARYAADDTGAEYYWNGSGWDKLDVEAPAVTTDEIHTESLDASYVVYDDGGTIRALPHASGLSEKSGSDFATVVNNAISAMSDGDLIHIKNGDYTVSSTITLDNFKRMRGDATWYPRLQLADSANTDLLEILDQKVTVQNMRLAGNKPNNSSGRGIYAHGNSGFDLRLEDMYVNNFASDGVYFDVDSGPSWFTNVVAETNAGWQWYLDGGGSANYLSMKGCLAWSGGGGVKALGYQNMNIHGNVFHNITDQGLYLESSRESSVTANVFRRIDKEAMYLKAGDLLSNRYNAIVGNTFKDCCRGSNDTYNVIHFDGSGSKFLNFNAIGFNTMQSGESNKPQYGVAVDGNPNNVIAGNVIDDVVTGELDTINSGDVVGMNWGIDLTVLRAELTSDLSLSNNTWTTIPYDTVPKDTRSEFDGTNDQWVPDESGWYRVTAASSFSNSGDQARLGMRFRDVGAGSNLIMKDTITSGSNFYGLSMSGLVEVTAGNAHQVDAINRGANDTVRGNANRTYFTAEWVGS